MQSAFNELNGIIAGAQRSATKLESGVKCESTRCRSALGQATKVIAQLKKMCLEQAKAMPVKSKAKKAESEPVDDSELPPPPALEREVTGVPKVEPPSLVAIEKKAPVKKPRKPKQK